MAGQFDRVLAGITFGRAENEGYRLVYRLAVEADCAEVGGVSRRLAQRLPGDRRKDFIRDGKRIAAGNADYAYSARGVGSRYGGNGRSLFHGVHLFRL